MEKIYHFDTKPLSTHMIVLSHVPDHSKVLEIGTASGYMGDYLITEKKCAVWGVEPDEQLFADASQQGYVKLFKATVEDFLKEVNPAERFDRIILADVLEHLVHPEKVLKEMSRLLKPDGRVVISLPNVAHYSIRRHLLIGRWNMSDAGILDRTHLRFYNRYTAETMIQDAGLHIETIYPIVFKHKKFAHTMWPLFGVRLGAWWSNIFGYQHVFVLKR